MHLKKAGHGKADGGVCWMHREPCASTTAALTLAGQ